VSHDATSRRPTGSQRSSARPAGASALFSRGDGFVLTELNAHPVVVSPRYLALTPIPLREPQDEFRGQFLGHWHLETSAVIGQVDDCAMQDGAIKNDLSSRKLGPSKGLSSLVHCVTSSDLASLAVPDQSTATLTWINAIAPVPHGSRSCPRFAPSYVKLTQLPLIGNLGTTRTTARRRLRPPC